MYTFEGSRSRSSRKRGSVEQTARTPRNKKRRRLVYAEGLQRRLNGDIRDGYLMFFGLRRLKVMREKTRLEWDGGGREMSAVKMFLHPRIERHAHLSPVTKHLAAQRCSPCFAVFRLERKICRSAFYPRRWYMHIRHLAVMRRRRDTPTHTHIFNTIILSTGVGDSVEGCRGRSHKEGEEPHGGGTHTHTHAHTHIFNTIMTRGTLYRSRGQRGRLQGGGATRRGRSHEEVGEK